MYIYIYTLYVITLYIYIICYHYIYIYIIYIEREREREREIITYMLLISNRHNITPAALICYSYSTNNCGHSIVTVLITPAGGRGLLRAL